MLRKGGPDLDHVYEMVAFSREKCQSDHSFMKLFFWLEDNRNIL